MGSSQPPPSIRKEDWATICRKFDKEMDKPQVAYKFSNNAEKLDTDRTGGVYSLSGLCTRWGYSAIAGLAVAGCMVAGDRVE